MAWFEAFILGLVQGITEFLPVSSSAHLKIVKNFFGINSTEEMVFFDLMCHLGTLIALLWFLRKDILRLLTDERGRLKLFFWALVPLIPAYFLLKPLRLYFSEMRFLGVWLCFTGVLLFLGSHFKAPKEKHTVRDAILIGAMQSAALIPGISRSASTISTASLLGWNIKEAVRFSFLLSIPTIIGGNCLELLKLTLDKTPILSFSSCLIGFLSSLGVGSLVVRWALPLLEKGTLRPFAYYCVFLGIGISLYMYYYG